MRAATLVEPDLLGEPLMLRPPRMTDVRARAALRSANESWLRPWDPTNPAQAGAPESRSPLEPLVALVRKSPARPFLVEANRWLQEASHGNDLCWLICYGAELAGELNIRQVTWGSTRSAEIGYWIDQKHAGLGIMPTAVAMGVDYCFQELGLHRLEGGIRLDNIPSRRVAEKLGFREEGVRLRLVHTDGAWQDHAYYAITTEDVPGGMLPRWRTALAASRSVS
ncbi:MAG TPA: GNAT family protein [Trebonia sp.]|nr:GNAT family protein [Trebonia sp.]